jgi:ferrochelatase
MTEKVAVILFNLGGPDKQDSIRPFLRNFFSDPNIIRAPAFVRFFLARYIAAKRSKCEAGSSYARLGGKSPLLENTKAQATALERELGSHSNDAEWKVFTAMRYWHPMALEVAAQVKQFGPDRIIALPLYPQYSTTTTHSSWQEWVKAAKQTGIDAVPTSLVCCYPENDGFVEASADLIREKYLLLARKAQEKGWNAPRLLFSAHGLPEKIVRGGDPYQDQCERSAAKIAAAIDIENLDWQICYQSRVGPLKWTRPSTTEALHRAAADKVPVLVYPHAFVSEHVETLVEIEIEYREEAKKLDIPAFERVETVGIHPRFIKGLANLAMETQGRSGIMPDPASGSCPDRFGQCCKKQFRI